MKKLRWAWTASLPLPGKQVISSGARPPAEMAAHLLESTGVHPSSPPLNTYCAAGTVLGLGLGFQFNKACWCGKVRESSQKAAPGPRTGRSKEGAGWQGS